MAKTGQRIEYLGKFTTAKFLKGYAFFMIVLVETTRHV